MSLPRTMGHETVGEVVAFGPDATAADKGDLKVGDVALVYPWLGCGKCATCVGGDENMCVVKPNSLGVYCDGGYADHMTVPNPKYLLEPERARSRHCGALCLFRRHHLQRAEEGRVCLQFADRHLRRRRARPDGAVAVEGDGRQGRHRRRYRRPQARGREAAGALATVDGKAPDALEQLAKAAGGPIRAVIDLVGNAQTTQLGFDCLTKGGKLVIVGLFGGGAPWALPLIPIKAITIQGSYVGNLRETQELLDLVRNKMIAPIPVTTMPLAKANEALDGFAERQTRRSRGADAVGCSVIAGAKDQRQSILRCAVPWIASLRSQ